MGLKQGKSEVRGHTESKDSVEDQAGVGDKWADRT